MLDVKKNRLDYGELLMPPEGFELRQAVAATYSADLDTLLSIPVALFYSQTLEGDLRNKDVQLIRAIQNTARMITVYHQEGQLKVPRAEREIHAYFENSLAPVLPGDAFTSFHPKMWVICYQNTESPAESLYRLIVLSRNLTFDRSWDVAVCLEGTPGDQTWEWNKPLIDFYQWLNTQKPFADAGAFLGELARVNFTQPERFSDYAFHPVGIPGYEKNPVAEKRASELLCLSPFLHEVALHQVAKNVDHMPVLLSRFDELSRLPPATLEKFDNYCLSETIVDGELMEAAEDGEGEPMQQDLHAKLFLFDDGEMTTWYLGSANATRAAFERNVEFMIELQSGHRSTRLRTVEKQLLGEDNAGGIFEAFKPESGGVDDLVQRKQRQTLRLVEYAIMKASISGEVVAAESGGNYDLHLTCDLQAVAIPEPFRVSIRPFVRHTQPQQLTAGAINRFTFPNISETRISQFVHVGVTDEMEISHEFLIRIEIEGIPGSRLDNIFKSIINSREKFFAYLRFLLTDEVNKEDFEQATQTGSSSSNGSWDLDIPIFEQLLVVASRNPKRLSEIDRAIASLRDEHDEEIIPASFLSLWEVFRSAMAANGAQQEAAGENSSDVKRHGEQHEPE